MAEEQLTNDQLLELIQQYKRLDADKDVQIASLQEQLRAASELQSSNDQLAAQVSELTAQIEQIQQRAEAFARDNANLRASLATYLQNTDGGQTALRELRLISINAQVTALTDEKNRIELAAN